MGWLAIWERIGKSRERRQNRKRNTVSTVGGRASDEADRLRKRILTVLLTLVFAVLTGLVAWMAVDGAIEAGVHANPEYRLAEIEILSDGSRMTGDKVLDQLKNATNAQARLAVGMGLFEFDLQTVQAFLAKNPVVKGVSVTRILPNRVRIQIAERMPIALVGENGFFGVDREGYLFAFNPSGLALPVIRGPADLRPGRQLTGLMMNAVEVVDALNRDMALGSRLRVEEIDTRDPEALSLKLPEISRVPLSWKDMDRFTPESRLALDGKLKSMAKALEDARAANIPLRSLDMTFSDDYIPAERER